MQTKTFFLSWIIFTTILLNPIQGIDYFHCKAATCNDFQYGLKKYPRQKEYLNVCYNTIRSLHDNRHKYGKCFDKITEKLRRPCILALVSTIRSCVDGLQGLTESQAKYYCGHRLMQNCAEFIGLENFPFPIDYPRPNNDDH